MWTNHHYHHWLCWTVLCLCVHTATGGRYGDPAELPKLVIPMVLTAAVLLVLLFLLWWFKCRGGKFRNKCYSKYQKCCNDHDSMREEAYVPEVKKTRTIPPPGVQSQDVHTHDDVTITITKTKRDLAQESNEKGVRQCGQQKVIYNIQADVITHCNDASEMCSVGVAASNCQCSHTDAQCMKKHNDFSASCMPECKCNVNVT